MNEGRGGFASKSVQKTSFKDVPGQCGWQQVWPQARDEENALDKDDPSYINSRAVV